MKVEVGTVVLKGLPRTYSRAVETGLAVAIRQVLGGAGNRQTRSVEVVHARLSPDWRNQSPERFVRTLAETICGKAGLL